MKRYIIGTLIVLIALNTAVITLFFFLHTRSAFEQILNRQINDTEQQVTNRLSGFDIILGPFEQEAAAHNERVIEEVYQRIKEISEGAPLKTSNQDLRRIALDYPGVDIYLIGADGVVQKSTLESDVGLDLFSLEDEFADFLMSLYGRGTVSTQRLSISNMTGRKMIYSYYSPEGSSWLLETSVDFTGFMKRRYSERLYRYLFEDYFTQISREHNALVSFDIIHQTSLSSRSLLSGELVPIEPEIVRALEEKQELRRRGDTLTVYRRFSMDELEYEFVKGAIARFEYDPAYFFKYLKRLYQLSAFAAIGLIIVFSSIVYILVDRKFVRRIEHLKEVLEAAAGGEYQRRVTYSSRIGEMNSLANSTNYLIDTIQNREAVLRSNLAERETLLNEIHHRVKNNLNVVVSLLNLQAQHISTVEQSREAFVNTHSRIYTMALTHEILYQSERLSEINMRSYLETFLARFRQYQEYLSEGITVHTALDDVLLDISYAVPCGIIINELLTNAFKHAFPEDRPGRIELVFRKTGDHTYLLSIQDDGVGMPEYTGKEPETSLGLPLIHTLTEQLGGSVEFQTNDGVLCTIRFSTEG
jgi:two-component sensor histidine kinase